MKDRELQVEQALFSLLKTKTNSPASLRQLAAEKLLLIVLGIMEYIHSNARDLCYCQKYLGCSPSPWLDTNNFFCCEVCQIITDYYTDIDYQNSYKQFQKIIIDILSRKEIIFRDLDLKEDPGDKYIFFDNFLIDKHRLFK